MCSVFKFGYANVSNNFLYELNFQDIHSITGLIIKEEHFKYILFYFFTFNFGTVLNLEKSYKNWTKKMKKYFCAFLSQRLHAGLANCLRNVLYDMGCNPGLIVVPGYLIFSETIPSFLTYLFLTFFFF